MVTLERLVVEDSEEEGSSRVVLEFGDLTAVKEQLEGDICWSKEV